MAKIESHYTLQQLAELLGLKVRGDLQLLVHRPSSMLLADKHSVCRFTDPRYVDQLKSCAAGVIMLAPQHADKAPAAATLLLSDQPEQHWLQLLRLFAKSHKASAGVHPTAIIGAGCRIDPSASIGANCVLGEGVSIAAGVILAAGCQLGDAVSIADDCELQPRVVIYEAVQLGQRVRIHAGTVIGADGFGNLPDAAGHWQKIPQLGSVRIGSDVEIGANCTIDCGALEDSIIGDGVRIDNLVHLGHNVVVGAHTAIAAASIVAGSVQIGAHCMIGGGCSIGGHLQIADRVILTATSAVSKSIPEPGVYSSGQPVQARSSWHKSVIHYRNLDKIVKRVKKLEQKHD